MNYLLILVSLALLSPSLALLIGANETLRAGWLGLLCVSAFTLAGTFKKMGCQPLNQIYAAASAWLMIALTSAYFSVNLSPTDALFAFAQYCLVIMWVLAISSYKWNADDLKTLNYIALIIIVANLLVTPISSAGLSPHKNLTGSLMITLAAIGKLASVHKPKLNAGYWTIGLALLVTLIVGARSSTLAIMIFLSMSAFMPRINGSKNIRLIFPVVFFGSIFTLVYTYTILYDLPIYDKLETLVHHYTSQNLYSGRNMIWPIMFDAILNKPWLGYGPGTKPNMFLWINALDVTWSAHNLYISVAIQTGVLGVAALLYLFIRLWFILTSTNLATNAYASIAASLLPALWFNQTFEVSLTQNNLIVGIALWVVPSIGLSQVLRSTKK